MAVGTARVYDRYCERAAKPMKVLLKAMLNNLFVLLNAPCLLIYFLLRPISRKDELFAGFSQFYSLFPGQYGIYLRRNFYRFTMTHLGQNVVIGFGTLFSHQDIEIGDNVYIGPQCNVGLCKIGAECLIGSGVHILSGSKQHSYREKKPLRNTQGSFLKITIGRNTWIGNQALLMSNVGDDCVIGATVTVTKEVANSFVVVCKAVVDYKINVKIRKKL